MNTQPTGDELQLDQFVSAYLEFLDGESDAFPAVGDLPAHLQAAAAETMALLDATWATASEADGSPHSDEVASRFGFDRAGQTILLDGNSVRAQRKRSGLDLRELAEAANRAGAATTVRQLSDLELSRTHPADQPLVSALVAVLGVHLNSIEAATELSSAHAWLYSDDFDNVVASWAEEFQRDRASTTATVRQRVLAAAFRADDVSVEQLREIVKHVLESLEP